MDITLVLLIFLLDCLLLYNINYSNFTRNEKVFYSLIVILLPVIGIPIYYELLEYRTKSNGHTCIFNKILDIILILIVLLIILSMLLNQLTIDSLLGRTAVILALIYNLSYFSKRKKMKMILLFVAVILIVIATIIKVYFE